MILVLNQFMQRIIGNMQNFTSQFNQFKNTFRGNPQQQVQNLLNSGQMSQQQFNELQQMAKQIQSIMGNGR